ncbi:thermonuclease family protein [Planctomicrobium sp. SH661]|uniref:thermonuclease family protein n=1 Tax=Planctomicrobium sp. SH661 TaxID=3448124 RepID=UPI003F5B733C
MYEYRTRITRVIDGDTVVGEIDLGFRIALTVTLRLVGINAPEIRGSERPRGLAARQYLESLLEELTGQTGQLVVRTQQDVTEKYGRYLAELISGEVNLNHALVTAGHAVPTNSRGQSISRE